MKKLTEQEYNILEKRIKPIFSLEDAVKEFSKGDVLEKQENGEYRSISIINPGNDATCTRYQYDFNKWTDFKGYGKRVDGDQIDYVVIKENLSCREEAIQILAEKKGLLDIHPESKPDKDNIKTFLKQCTGFNNTLNSAKFKPVRDYLNSIGITQERINDNLIGFKEYGKKISETEFKLDPRIVYPYWNSNNEIVFWIARALPEDVFNKVYPDLDYYKTYDIKVVIDENGNKKFKWQKYKKLSIKNYLENGYNVIPNIPYNYRDINPFEDTIVVCEGIPDSEALISQNINSLCISSTDGTDKKGWNDYIIPVLKDIENIIISGDNDDPGKGATVNWILNYLFPNKIFNVEFSVVPRTLKESEDPIEVYTHHFFNEDEVNKFKDYPKKPIKDIGEYLQAKIKEEERLKEERKDTKDKNDQINKLDYIDKNRINGFSYLALYYLYTYGFNARNKYIKEVVYPYKRFLQPYQIDVIVEDLKRINNEDLKLSDEDIKAIEKAFRLKPKESHVVNSIIKDKKLIHEHGVGFYEYQEEDHVWKELDPELVERIIDDELGEQFSEGSKYSSVEKHLRAKVHDPKPEFNQKDVLVFNNGTLYLNNGKHEFRENEFNPEDHVTFKCNYDFIEDADYLQWESFLTDVLEVIDKDGFRDVEETCKKIVLAQEYMGYILHKNSMHGQKCLVLVGDSNNGKSVFMDAIRALFDEKAVTDIPMQKLGENFQTIALKNSVLNISEETVEDLRGNTLKIFNSIVAGGTIRDSKKNLDVIEFRPRAKWIISGNNDFFIGDKSNAVYNRLLYLDFPFTFTNDPEELKRKNCKKKDPFMLDKLLENLPGIFRFALEGYERLIKNNFEFTVSNEHLNEIEKLKISNNSVREFLVDSDILECVSIHKDKFFFYKDYIYKRYENFLEPRHREPIHYNKFFEELIRQLKDLGIEAENKRPRINGKQEQTIMINSLPDKLMKKIRDKQEENKTYKHLEIL